LTSEVGDHKYSVYGVEKFIGVGSVCAYPKFTPVPFKEEDLWNGFPEETNATYGMAKKMMMLQTQAYKEQYGFNGIHLLMVNLYGPGDVNLSRIFPKIITTVMKKKNPIIFDVGAVRDFLYIDDCIEGYIRLGEKHLNNVKRTRVFNFGTGKPVKVTDLVKRIIKKFGDTKIKLIIKSVPAERDKEIIRQYVSITKAKNVLDWQPKVSLNKGIELTIDWYKANTDMLT